MSTSFRIIIWCAVITLGYMIASRSVLEKLKYADRLMVMRNSLKELGVEFANVSEADIQQEADLALQKTANGTPMNEEDGDIVRDEDGVNTFGRDYEFPDSDMETEEEEEIYVDGLAEEGYKIGGAGYIGKTTRFNVSH